MTMAGRRAHAQALCLVVLFVMSSWLSLVAPAGLNTSVLAEENVVSEAGQGDVMNLTLTPTPNTMFKLADPVRICVGWSKRLGTPGCDFQRLKRLQRCVDGLFSRHPLGF